MIIKTEHRPWIYALLQCYSLIIVRLHFKKIHLEGKLPHFTSSVMLVSNHISWWDGFWLVWLNKKYLRKRFHFMMLEDKLRQYGMFRFVGGFSIQPGTRTVVESLQYASELLSESTNVVAIFPQGSIQSMHSQKFVFAQGVEKILRNRVDTSVLMVVNLLDYFSDAKPTLWMYVKEYDYSESLNQAYQRFYDNCVERQQLKAY